MQYNFLEDIHIMTISTAFRMEAAIEYSILDILFGLVFLSQILLISFYLPKRMLGRIRSVMTSYPPEKYPRLYPKPLAYYQKAQVHFQYINFFIMAVGFILLFVWAKDVTNNDWGGIVAAYFMFQCIPLILVEISAYKHYQLMQQADARTTRKAALQPRRLFDIVSPVLLGIAGFVYLAFILFIHYVNQFEFPWFGGYLNIVGITALNLFLAGAAAWHLYGKTRDPYQAYEDRISHIKVIAKQMVLISILATLFVMISITLAALEMRHLMPISKSIYFQLIILLSFRSLHIDEINFEVYKEEPLAT